MLGHELAHVVQQRTGRVKNPLGSGIAVVQDHALEAEADRLGRHAAAHRVAVQPKMPPGAAQPSSPVRISPAISTGPGSYRLTAGTGGRQIGSVMVHARDRGVVEVTDLGVDQSQRGHGIGQMLVASAARTGLHSGKSKVTLAAQDKGSGHLTRWYKEMGFTQTGVNQRGFPQLEAPISRVLAGTAQRKLAWRGVGALQPMNAYDPVKALTKLAVPKVFSLPDQIIADQNEIVRELEDMNSNGKLPMKVRNVVLPDVLFVCCLGGVEVPSGAIDPNEGLDNQAARLIKIEPARGIGDVYDAIANNKMLKSRIVKVVLSTLKGSGQLKYLQRSGLANGIVYKILVEVHYYRNRDVVAQPGFHKDTLGQTLFVNLNFVADPSEEFAGPEYILNPPPVEAHEHNVKTSLPHRFQGHLAGVRKGLPAPTEIAKTRVKGSQVVSFVDETVHHKSPLYQSRTVSGENLGKFLKERYPQNYARAVVARASPQPGVARLLPARGNPDQIYHFLNDQSWDLLIAVTESPQGEYNRFKLRESRMPEHLINLVIDRYGNAGFTEVSIPSPTGTSIKADVRRPEMQPYRRRASFSKKLPPPANRRFFRMWVRAVERTVPEMRAMSGLQ